MLKQLMIVFIDDFHTASQSQAADVPGNCTECQNPSEWGLSFLCVYIERDCIKWYTNVLLYSTYYLINFDLLLFSKLFNTLSFG